LDGCCGVCQFRAMFLLEVMITDFVVSLFDFFWVGQFSFGSCNKLDSLIDLIIGDTTGFQNQLVLVNIYDFLGD
jgi:hypothetical protein